MSSPHPYRSIARIAVPTSLEMVFQLVLTFVVQLAIGILGTVALAAAGFVNSLVLVAMVSFGTLGAAAAILAARAHGADDAPGISRVVTGATVLALAGTLLVCLPAALLAPAVLAVFGAPAEVAAAGGAYFQVMVLALPFMVHAAVTANTFRSLGHARTPMVVSMLGVLVNGALAYGLLLGTGPLPELGLLGAAIATLVAQALRAALLFWLLHFRPGLVPLLWPRSLDAWRSTVRQLLSLALPLSLTQVSWSGAAFVYALLFGRLSTAALAGSQIVFALEGVFVVASFGLMSAATALIGQSVGGGDPARASGWARRVQRAGLLTGVCFGVLFALTAFFLDGLYPNVSRLTLYFAFWGILINAAFQVVKVRNMILGGGVLPSGGDTRGVVIGNLIGPLVGLSLAYLLGFPLGLGAWGVFAGRVADEAVKAAYFTWRARRLRWHDLVPEATPEAEQRAA